MIELIENLRSDKVFAIFQNGTASIGIYSVLSDSKLRVSYYDRELSLYDVLVIPQGRQYEGPYNAGDINLIMLNFGMT